MSSLFSLLSSKNIPQGIELIINFDLVFLFDSEVVNRSVINLGAS